MVPEIWIEVSKKTGVKELSLTTRDIPDYDVLMRKRIDILNQRRIRLALIQEVISSIKPLPGAKSFLDRLRSQEQVLILSDTFLQFAMPLMKRLGYPTLFCNELIVDKKGFISGYNLRQKNGKEKAVKALQSAGFEVRAAGDSYNDISMLQAANRGIFFRAPETILKRYKNLRCLKTYPDLFRFLTRA